MAELYIFRSALKHGCSEEDIEKAFFGAVCEIVEQADPRKVIRLGFDTVGRLLEVGAIVEEDVRVFHAMKARTRYVEEAERRK